MHKRNFNPSPGLLVDLNRCKLTGTRARLFAQRHVLLLFLFGRVGDCWCPRRCCFGRRGCGCGLGGAFSLGSAGALEVIQLDERGSARLGGRETCKAHSLRARSHVHIDRVRRLVCEGGAVNEPTLVARSARESARYSRYSSSKYRRRSSSTMSLSQFYRHSHGVSDAQENEGVCCIRHTYIFAQSHFAVA